ncbi:MAG: alpha/beta fold hydrolase [Lysobacterales bacterium]
MINLLHNRLNALRLLLIVGLAGQIGGAYAQEALLQTTANPAIHQGYVDTPDGQLHYWEAGQGEALLLVHQSSSSVEEYAGLVPFLADRYRLITWDWPGHGSSDDPDHELGVDEYSAGALAVLAHLKVKKFHVLGHHGGALIAMNLAWKHPDRVEGIILSGTSGVKDTSETKAFTDSLDLKNRKRLDREGRSLDAAWQRYVGYMPNASAEQVLVAYLNNVVTRLRPFDAHYGVLRWDRRPALASLKDRHVLLTQGERDEYVSHQENLLELLPKAQRTVVKNAGTFLFFEKPKACAAMIRDYLDG